MLSARLRPIALTRMRTSPAAGRGSETSLNLRTSGAPKDANSTMRDMTPSLLVRNAASKGWGTQATPPASRQVDAAVGSTTSSRSRRLAATSRKARRKERSGLWPFFDRVDAIGVKGEIILDRREGGVGSLITPHRVDPALASQRDAVIAAIAFVRAVSGVIGALEERHIDIFARDVLHRGIRCFAQCQRFSRVGDDPARDRDDDPSGIAFDRDRMIWPRNFDRLCCDADVRFHGFTSLCLGFGSTSYTADFPPSTGSTWPVVKDASEQRNRMALAISSGC